MRRAQPSTCVRSGYDLAIASWGLAVGVAADAAIDGLLAALCSAPNAARMTLTLCEAHPARRDAVLQRLQARAQDVSLVVLPADPAPPSTDTWDEAVAQLQSADHAGD